MKYKNSKEVTLEDVEIDGAKDVKIRWLITEKDGAQNFIMRLFELGPSGYTPWHQHEWEHEMFILEGEGFAKKEGGEVKFKSGDALFIEPMEWHNFNNTGEGVLKFLCLIPNVEE